MFGRKRKAREQELERELRNHLDLEAEEAGSEDEFGRDAPRRAESDG